MKPELEEREDRLRKKLEQLELLEAQVKSREQKLKEQEKAKKQVLLRLTPSLWNELAAWAEEDYRSINSQIEYLLAEAVKKHRV